MSQALHAYRHLLRATRVAFNGDTPLIHAARTKARHDFDMNAHLPAASPEIAKEIAHAEDVAKILRRNVVQAEQTEEGGIFKLRIHDEIERGDNESINKMSKKEMGSLATGECRRV